VVSRVFGNGDGECLVFIHLRQKAPFVSLQKVKSRGIRRGLSGSTAEGHVGRVRRKSLGNAKEKEANDVVKK
jgi:nucleosome binding factor SPN SPT16 subunit